MRQRRPSQELRSTRRSHIFYPSNDTVLQQRVRDQSFEGFYTFQLYEDLGWVIPYNFDRRAGAIARVTGPDTDRAEPLITDAMAKYDNTSFDDSVQNFVRSTAQQLVFSGLVVYEIDYLYDRSVDPGDSSARPSAFSFELIVPGTFSQKAGLPIQYIPEAIDACTDDDNGLRYVELDPDKLVRFEIDQRQRQSVSRAIETLRAASRQHSSEMALMHRSTIERTSYDLVAHQKERAELLFRATEPIGWHFRGLFDNHQLAPHQVWRHLKFLDFQISLRDSIINQLNDSLATIGAKVGFQAGIEVSGLSTHEDIDAAFDDLQTGRLGLSDLLAFANQLNRRTSTESQRAAHMADGVESEGT